MATELHGFTDHKRKVAIRKNWCKPLLRKVYDKLGYKFVYMGLPGVEALDIKDWIAYIDYIIAFICRKYPVPSSINQPKDNIQKLNSILLEMERKNEINSYSLYDGYIEEVILKKKDLTGKEFKQSKTITVYNLDFCNEITSPMKVFSDDNSIIKVYKFNAIEELLRHQKTCAQQSDKNFFIFFITMRDKFNSVEFDRFVDLKAENEITEYLKKIETIKEKGIKEIFKLKAYVYQMMSFFCKETNFLFEFFPMLHYHGTSQAWLLHFTMIGKLNINDQKPNLIIQEPKDFLYRKTIRLNDDLSFQPIKILNFHEEESSLSLEAAFEASNMFKQGLI